METMIINSFKWRVEYSDALEDNRYGSTLYNKCLILINNEIDKQHIKSVLAHEITHAYLFSYGFFYKDNFSVEEVCELIGQNIGEIYRLTNEAYNILENI